MGNLCPFKLTCVASSGFIMICINKKLKDLFEHETSSTPAPCEVLVITFILKIYKFRSKADVLPKVTL